MQLQWTATDQLPTVRKGCRAQQPQWERACHAEWRVDGKGQRSSGGAGV